MPCFGALCVGFSLVGLFTAAVMLPASLLRLHRTADFVTRQANAFKVESNVLWLEMGDLGRQLRQRRDSIATNRTRSECGRSAGAVDVHGFELMTVRSSRCEFRRCCCSRICYSDILRGISLRLGFFHSEPVRHLV